MSTEIDAGRLLVYRACAFKDAGMPFGPEAAKAKLFRSALAMRVANLAVQIHGGYGYSKEYDVERYFRDAKVTEIYEGTSEVQRMVIARAISKECPDFDLILCGRHTSDSETARVGPQLAEELDIPAVAYVEQVEISGRRVRMQRESDDFLETLEMDMPGLITATTTRHKPRYAPMSGLQAAFETGDIAWRNLDHLGLESGTVGMNASPTRILDVYSPTARKRNIVLKGSAKKSAEILFDRFGDKLSGAMAKDLKTHDHDRNDDEREDE